MSNKGEILELERRFWKTMAGAEHTKSAELLAGHAAMVSSGGVQTFTPEEYVEMSGKSPFVIKDWAISDEKVIFPTPETAVCIYKVKQTVERDGKSDTFSTQDSSVWIKTGAAWKCILHTEGAPER